MASGVSEANALAPRPQSASVTTMTEYVLPQHSNVFGGVFGGQIMAWVDLCAAICAQRHSGRLAVTAFVDDLKFERPVRIGEVVRLEARVNAVFKTSMEIAVEVTGEDSRTRETWPCVRALLVFVTLGDDGKPTRAPALVLDDDSVRASQAAGEARRSQRLTTRSSR
jgi:acyl-CoA hydrolase